MKKYINILFVSLVGILLYSCATSSLTDGSFVKKRRYNKGWHVDLGGNHSQSLTAGTSAERNMVPSLKDFSASEVSPVTNLESTENLPAEKNTTESDTLNNIPASTKNGGTNQDSLASVNVEFTDSLEFKCDTIVFKDGKRILAKIGTINKEKVSYKLCDNPEGPEFSHETSLIEKIQFTNGTETLISDYYTFDKKEKVVREQEGEVAKEDKKIEGFSIASLGLVALSVLLLATTAWVAILLTLPLALGFGITGLIRIKQNVKKYKARWIALSGTVLSSIGVAILATLLILLAAFVGVWS